MGEQTPRIRRQPIPDDAHLVVRGDEDLSVQERMARMFLRRHPSWGRYGLSGYHATDDDALPRRRLNQSASGVAWA